MGAQDPSLFCLITLPAAALSWKGYLPRVLIHWVREIMGFRTGGRKKAGGEDIFMLDLPQKVRSWGLFL